MHLLTTACLERDGIILMINFQFFPVPSLSSISLNFYSKFDTKDIYVNENFVLSIKNLLTAKIFELLNLLTLQFSGIK